MPLAERGAHLLDTWHLNDLPGRELLDVTDLGYHSNRCTSRSRTVVTGRGRRPLAAVGARDNPLGRIPTPTSSRRAAAWNSPPAAPGGASSVSPSPARPPRRPPHLGGRPRPGARLPPDRHRRPRVDLRLADIYDARSRLTVVHPDLDTAPLPVQPLLPGLGADQVVAEVSAKGHLRWVVPSTAVQHRHALARRSSRHPRGRRSRALSPHPPRSAPARLGTEQAVALPHGAVPAAAAPRTRCLRKPPGAALPDSPRAIYKSYAAATAHDRGVVLCAHPDGFHAMRSWSAGGACATWWPSPVPSTGSTTRASFRAA